MGLIGLFSFVPLFRFGTATPPQVVYDVDDASAHEGVLPGLPVFLPSSGPNLPCVQGQSHRD